MTDAERARIAAEIKTRCPTYDDFLLRLLIARPDEWHRLRATGEIDYARQLAAIVEAAEREMWIWELVLAVATFEDGMQCSPGLRESLVSIARAQPFREAIVKVHGPTAIAGVGVQVSPQRLIVSIATANAAFGRDAHDVSIPSEESKVYVESAYPDLGDSVDSLYAALDRERQVATAHCDVKRWCPHLDLAVLRLHVPSQRRLLPLQVEASPQRTAVLTLSMDGTTPRLDLLNGTEVSSFANQALGGILLDPDASELVGVLRTGVRPRRIESRLIAGRLGPSRDELTLLVDKLLVAYPSHRHILALCRALELNEVVLDPASAHTSWSRVVRAAYAHHALPLLRDVIEDKNAKDALTAFIIGPVIEARFARHVHYPLLNEWDSFPTRWLLDPQKRRLRTASRVLVRSLVVFSLAVIVLACFAHAACITVEISDSALLRKRRALYGYLAELPHGPWLVVGLPALMFVFANFIERTTTFFRDAERDRLLVVERSDGKRVVEGPSFLEYIARKNRRWFRWVKWAVMVLAGVLIVVSEAESWNEPVFGWVQARQTDVFAPARNGTPHSLSELEKVARLPIEPLCRQLGRSA